jgi:hypothetical protein
VHQTSGDDLGVVQRVDRVRHAVDQLGNELLSADGLELAAAGQLFGQGDRVGRIAQVVHVADGEEDLLVNVAVEVVDGQERHDVVEMAVIQQHAAEHTFLGLHVLRRDAVSQEGEGIGLQGAPPIPAAAADRHWRPNTLSASSRFMASSSGGGGGVARRASR